MDGYWVWCGSAIRGEDGRYHLFASRWPRSLPFFEGYIRASEIVRAVADTPTGPFEFDEIVLPARGRRHWDGLMTHNPTIHRWNGMFLLFYIGSSSETIQDRYGRIRIGLATSPSVFGPWKRFDAPILEPRPGKWDSTIVTNPAPCVLPDGRILLIYRSNTPQGLRLGAAMAERFDRPFRRIADEPVIRFESGHWVEDPYIWHAGDHFEMLAKDCTGITGEGGAGLHARSDDGTNWQLTVQPQAYSRNLVWDDGSVETLGHLERPQLLLEDGRPVCLYLAAADGPSDTKTAAWSDITRTWNVAIPLRR